MLQLSLCVDSSLKRAVTLSWFSLTRVFAIASRWHEWQCGIKFGVYLSSALGLRPAIFRAISFPGWDGTNPGVLCDPSAYADVRTAPGMLRAGGRLLHSLAGGGGGAVSADAAGTRAAGTWTQRAVWRVSFHADVQHQVCYVLEGWMLLPLGSVDLDYILHVTCTPSH